MKLTKNKLTAVAAILATGICGGAQAGVIPMTWTDVVDFSPALLITGTKIYTHTLENFNASTDSVSSYSLTFNLYDDNDKSGETAVFSQPGNLLDEVWFNLSGTEHGSWTLAGVWQLDHTGSLTIAITALAGDFYLGGSTLRVSGERNTNSVPEPAALALFGAGLLGVGLMRRKRNIA